MTSTLRAVDLVGLVDTAPASIAAHVASDYLHDESKLAAGSALSLAQPETVAELRRVIRWHASHHHAVVCSGSRTGVAASIVSDTPSHLIALDRLRGVLSLDRAQKTVRVLAGTWLSELTDYLAREATELAFPVDPTERSASFGGMLSTNAGGARSFAFGSIRDWVQGVVVELPSGNTLSLERGTTLAHDLAFSLEDGDAVRTLSGGVIPKPATKNACGFFFAPDCDAVDLFIGAEGTLGTISEVTLKLHAAPQEQLLFLQGFASVDSAFQFVEALRRRRDLGVVAIEFLDSRSHALARQSQRAPRVLDVVGGSDCSVMVEFFLDADLDIEALEHMVTSAGGDLSHSIAGASDHDTRDIRAFRHSVPERVNQIIAQRKGLHPTLHKLATDMAVPNRELRWVYAFYEQTLTDAGLEFAIFGHVGDNHFHVNLLPRDGEELLKAKALYVEIGKAVVARGGCIAAEHGIGRIKRGFMPLQYTRAELETMRRIKQCFDPEWRYNAGAVIESHAPLAI